MSAETDGSPISSPTGSSLTSVQTPRLRRQIQPHVPRPGDGDPTHPQNDGTGTLTVSTSGQVKFKGTLGDGTKVSQSAIISQDGDWPFYIPLYKGGGQIMGWLNFDGAGNVGGPTSWIKLPNAHNKAFPDGFELNPTATGSEQ